MTDHSGLLSAVTEDHPCLESSCDIAAMIDQGFGQIAAWMLCSATNEHHAVDLVVESGADTMPDDFRECDDWPAWLEFHQSNGVECSSCEAFNYPVNGHTPYSCGNCLADLPASTDDHE